MVNRKPVTMRFLLHPQRWQGLLRHMHTRWRYTVEGPRDLRLDMLRGLCVFFMLLAHITGFYLRPLATGVKYLLAAELFVVIFGILIGMLSRRAIEQHGFWHVARQHLLRSAQMYLCLAVFTLGFQTVGVALHQPWAQEAGRLPALAFLGRILTLQFSFYMTDMFLMYFLFTALAPFALWLVRRRLWWLLLGSSWGLWLLYQLAPREHMPLSHIETFHPLAWQIFFCHALVAGFYREWLAHMISGKLRLALLICSAGVTLVLTGMYLFELATSTALIPEGGWFDKFHVGPGRIAIAALAFPFLFLLLTYCWRPLLHVAGWLLMPLGRHAMLAFVLHLPLIALAYALMDGFPSLFAGDSPLRWATPLLGTTLVWSSIVAAGALRRRPAGMQLASTLLR